MPLFEFEMKGLEEVLEKFKQAGETIGKVKPIFRERLREAVKYAVDNFLTGGTTDTRLRVRSGRLRSSFWYEVKSAEKDVEGRLGFIRAPNKQGEGDPLVYARTHEFGATILPKKGKFLTIPTKFAQTPAGVVRGPARSFPDTFIKKSKGTPIIFQRLGKRTYETQRGVTTSKAAAMKAVGISGPVSSRGKGEIVPLFILKEKITVPARPTLRPTAAKYLPIIVKDIEKALSDLLK